MGSGEGKSGGGEENNGIALLHAFKKAIYHNGLTVGLPGCLSVKGIRPMPNSFMGMDMEK